MKTLWNKIDSYKATYNEMNKEMVSIINGFLRTREGGVYYPDGALNIGNGSADVDEIRQLKYKSGFEVIRYSRDLRYSYDSSIVIATNSNLLTDESFRILSHICFTENIYICDSYDVCEVYEEVLDMYCFNDSFSYMSVDKFISSICMPNLTDNQISEIIARLKDYDGTQTFDSVLAKDCNWLKLTDPDTLQFRRDIDVKNGVYVYYQLDSSCVSLDTVTVGGDISNNLCIEAVIDLSKYSDDDKNEALQSFGYSQTWSSFCREHGLKAARELISEMIFESLYL